MRIAFVSSPFFDTSPSARRAEAQVAELARQMVARGHEVTVYGTGTSQVSGRLRYRFATPAPTGHLLACLRHLHFAWSEIRLEDVDVVHCHEPAALALAGELASRTVFSVFAPANDELDEYFADFEDVTFVASSTIEARRFARTRIGHAIFPGLDPELYPAGRGAGGTIAVATRYATSLERALAIADGLGATVELVSDVREGSLDDLAARTPRLRVHTGLSAEERAEVLRHARVLLLPNRNDAFDLAPLEAMLTGTPVVALAGTWGEGLIEPGVTGEVAKDEDALGECASAALALERTKCRERAREQWTSFRLAGDYERLFLERLSSEGSSSSLDSPETLLELPDDDGPDSGRGI